MNDCGWEWRAERAFKAVLLCIVERAPSRSLVVQYFFAFMPLLAVIVEFFQLLAIVSAGLVSVPHAALLVLRAISLNFEGTATAALINTWMFWIGFAMIAVVTLGVAKLSRHFYMGQPVGPRLVMTVLPVSVSLLSSVIFIPITRLMLEQMHCSAPTYMLEKWCWGSEHIARAILGVFALLALTPISAIVVANTFNPDPNALDPLRCANGNVDLVVFATKVAIVAAEVFLSPASKKASLILYIAFGVLLVVVVNLGQPYFFHTMNRVRCAMFFTFASFAVSALVVLETVDDYTSLQAKLGLMLPVIPSFIIGLILLRHDNKSSRFVFLGDRIFSSISLGYSALDFYDFHLEALLKSPERLGMQAFFYEQMLHDHDAADASYSRADAHGLSGRHNKDFVLWADFNVFFDAGTDYDRDLAFLEFVMDKLPQGCEVYATTPPGSDASMLFVHWRLRMRERNLRVLWIPEASKALVQEGLHQDFPLQIQRLMWEIFGGYRTALLSPSYVTGRMRAFAKWHRKLITKKMEGLLVDVIQGRHDESRTTHDYVDAVHGVIAAMMKARCRILGQSRKQPGASRFDASAEVSAADTESSSWSTADDLDEDMNAKGWVSDAGTIQQAIVLILEDDGVDRISKAVFSDICPRLSGDPVIIVHHGCVVKPQFPASVRALRGLPEYRMFIMPPSGVQVDSCMNSCSRKYLGADMEPICTSCVLMASATSGPDEDEPLVLPLPPIPIRLPAGLSEVESSESALLPPSKPSMEKHMPPSPKTQMFLEWKDGVSNMETAPPAHGEWCRDNLYAWVMKSEELCNQLLNLAAVCGRTRPISVLSLAYRRLTGMRLRKAVKLFGQAVQAGVFRVHTRGSDGGRVWYSWGNSVMQSVVLQHMKANNHKQFRDLHFHMGEIYQSKHWSFDSSVWCEKHFRLALAVPRLLPIVASSVYQFYPNLKKVEEVLVLIDWMARKQHLASHFGVLGDMESEGNKTMSTYLPSHLRELPFYKDVEEHAYLSPKPTARRLKKKGKRWFTRRLRVHDPLRLHMEYTTTRARFMALFSYAMAVFYSDPRAAQRALHFAEGLVSSTDEYAMLLVGWSRSLYADGQVKAARDAADEAYKMSVSWDTTATAAFCRGYIARREKDLTNDDDAVKWYSLANEASRRTSDASLQATSLGALAMAERDAGSLGIAVVHFKESSELFLWSGLTGWYLDSLHGLSLTYILMGKFEKGLPLLRHGARVVSVTTRGYYFFKLRTAALEIGLLLGSVPVVRDAFQQLREVGALHVSSSYSTSVRSKGMVDILVGLVRALTFFHMHGLDERGTGEAEECVRVQFSTDIKMIPGVQACVELYLKALQDLGVPEKEALSLLDGAVSNSMDFVTKVLHAKLSREGVGHVNQASIGLAILGRYVRELILQNLKVLEEEPSSLPMEEEESWSDALEADLVEPMTAHFERDCDDESAGEDSITSSLAYTESTTEVDAKVMPEPATRPAVLLPDPEFAELLTSDYEAYGVGSDV